MNIVYIPHLDIIVPTPYGDVTSGLAPRFCPIQATWSGSILSRGAASINGIEAPNNAGKYMDGLEFGGEWQLRCQSADGNWHDYYYLLDSLGAAHLQERNYGLVDKTSEWDVLKTQATYAGEITVGDLLADLASDAAAASGTALDVAFSCFTTMVSVQGGAGISEAEARTYAISNSTYLTEINRILGWFGYILYADPTTGGIRIIAPLATPSLGPLTIHSDDLDLLQAEFTLDYGGIHSDVVVASNESGHGAVVGKTVTTETSMNHPDPTNWNLSKRFNPLFATVYRVADPALKAVAQQILVADRKGAKALKLTTAAFIPNPLWKTIGWEDKNGATGYWRVTGYEVSLSGTQVQTSLECIQVSA